MAIVDGFRAPPDVETRAHEQASEGSIMSTNTTFKDVMREVAALEDPVMRAANERRGDDHGVNLTKLRALAKRLKTQHDLALQLWATGDTAARLLATLVFRPKAFAATELDAMIRDIRSPKLLDWFIVNVVKPGRHAEAAASALEGRRRPRRPRRLEPDDRAGRQDAQGASTSRRCSTRSRRR